MKYLRINKTITNSQNNLRKKYSKENITITLERAFSNKEDTSGIVHEGSKTTKKKTDLIDVKYRKSRGFSINTTPSDNIQSKRLMPKNTKDSYGGNTTRTKVIFSIFKSITAWV